MVFWEGWSVITLGNALHPDRPNYVQAAAEMGQEYECATSEAGSVMHVNRTASPSSREEICSPLNGHLRLLLQTYLDYFHAKSPFMAFRWVFLHTFIAASEFGTRE